VSVLVVRPLERADGPALRYGFAHLSPRSRALRFLGVRPSLTDAEWARLLAVDHWHHGAVLACATAPRRPVGVARYVRTTRFDRAEVAVAVIDDWQARGVGRALLRELVPAARAAGIRELCGTLAVGNHGAWALLRGLGEARVLRHDAGVAEVVVSLRLRP
jgi:GNAT superfamily N-acetyltransferase